MSAGLSRRGRVTPPKFLGNILLILLLVATSDGGCRRSATDNSGITVHEQILPSPVQVGPASIAIQLADDKAQPVSNAAITVEGNMAHPGMAPTFSKAAEISSGNYRADLNFNMGGDWVLLLHIRLSNGQNMERQLDVRGVRSN